MYKKPRRPKDKAFPDLPHMREVKTITEKGEKVIISQKTNMQEEDRQAAQQAKKTQARHQSHQERVKNGKSMKDFRRDLYGSQNA